MQKNRGRKGFKKRGEKEMLASHFTSRHSLCTQFRLRARNSTLKCFVRNRRVGGKSHHRGRRLLVSLRHWPTDPKNGSRQRQREYKYGNAQRTPLLTDGFLLIAWESAWYFSCRGFNDILGQPSPGSSDI